MVSYDLNHFRYFIHFVCIILTVYIFILGKYLKLKQAFLTLPDYSELTQSFLQLATFHPLLTLHYVNLSLLVNPSSDWVCYLLWF